MDNSQPQPTPQAPQGPAPRAPIDIEKTVRTGWTAFTIAVVVTVVGLFFGIALAAGAIIAAYAGRLGLQTKNKALATTSLIFCGLALALFITAVVINS